MRKILITGGCGFIGSHLVEYLFYKFNKCKILVFDKISYAANVKNLNNIISSKRLEIIKKDIKDFNQLLKYTKKIDLLIHAAAESHVDSSFDTTKKFIETNVIGTRNVIEACKINKVKKIIHVSTDEVYGEIFKGSFKENSRFNPSNPYSSSKAAAEMIVNGYKYSYKLPIIIVRANNIFGTRQHPEKLIASCCSNLIKGKKIFLHGSGSQKRSFLFVEDFCRAIYKIIIRGKLNNVYNIGSKFEYKNRDVVKLILRKFNKNFKKNVVKIKDRPFNDFRYSINLKKIKKLSWKPKYKLEDKIDDIIQWYKSNYKQFK